MQRLVGIGVLLLMSVVTVAGAAVLPPVTAGDEPGQGPLDIAARLVSMSKDGAPLKAIVQVDLLSSTTDAEATVSLVDDPNSERRTAVPLGRTFLLKGERRSMQFPLMVKAGRENHIYLLARARGTDGSLNEVITYLRVNLDPSLEPVIVGEYAEYPAGLAVEEP
jgi:hypothetical protein